MDKENTISYYFFHVIDYRKHMFSVNTLNRSFYSLCILDSSSFINVDKKSNLFEIKLYFINYFIDTNCLPELANNSFYSYNEYILLTNYLNTFVNSNKELLLLEIKNSIFLLDKIIDF
jgi:hypothetical protein